MRELFVWYRVRTEGAAAARIAVLAMQEALRAENAGLVARLLVRQDRAPLQTWMETYTRPANASGIDDDLEVRIAAAARLLDAYIDGDRHAEAFET